MRSSGSSSAPTLPSSTVRPPISSPKKKRHRPIIQPDPPKGIDKRTWTRYATVVEKELAMKALADLDRERLVVVLVPAPDPHFEGHMIRAVECRNPKWFQYFVRTRRDGPRQVKRSRVIRALQRVAERGRVRGNGYERDLLSVLKEF